MDIAAILALIERGISIVSVAIEAGQNAKPAIEAVMNLITGAKAGTITAEDLAKTEALLDGMIAEFNAPLPED